LHRWIDALPVPAPAVYLVTFLIVVITSNALAWVDGYVPVGSFDAYFTVPAFFLILGYGGIHYLDRAAARAWATFRPLTSLGAPEADRFAYELTTMPMRPTLACAALGVVTAVSYLAFQYGKPLDLAEGALAIIVGLPFTCVVFTGTWTLVYHALHQLRVIGRVHRYVESIEVLHMEGLHAFARVTAATGIALLALGYAGVPSNPDALSNPQVIAWAALTTSAAIGCFVAPLLGIQGLIATEKSRRLELVSRLLEQALDDLHRRVEQGDLSDAAAVNDRISSLLAERDVVARTSTWPWAPEILRGFITALVLPVLLWLVYRVLDQAVL
jgi:hypothetical protein